MKTTLLIMAAGIGSRFGTGIKQLEPVDDAGHIIMDYSIHDAIEAGFNHVVFRFLYNGIIIKHQKTEPTYTKTSLFLCEKRRFFMARREKGVVPIIYFEKERGKSF